MRKLMLLMLAPAAVAAVSAPEGTPPPRYVGAETCAACHDTGRPGDPFDVWRSSRHARGFESLQSAHSDSAARAIGSKKRAVESPDCLFCHAPEFRVEPGRALPSLDTRAGVQCETCHGPGSNHVEAARSGRADRETGLIPYRDFAAIERKCRGCHICGTSDFRPQWARIAHSESK